MKNTKYFYRFLLGMIVGIIYYQVTFCQGPPYNVWSARYNGPANMQDSATCITGNSTGSIFITGWSASGISTKDIVTIKYGVSGDSEWVNRYSLASTNNDPLAITADNNAVYVTGWTIPPSGNRDIITIKYNASTGATMWVKTYNGSGNGGDYGFAITVDPSGNVYVAGRTDIGGISKFIILKYDPSGNVPSGWPVIYTGTLSSSFDEAHAIKLDASGNIYVTGEGGVNSGNEDYLTLKLNSSGIVQWAKKHNGTANSTDNAVDMVLNSAATAVYVTGYSANYGTTFDYETIKYNASTGDSLAAAVYNGSANGADFATAMTIDPSGNIYVTGYSLNSGGTYDYVTFKYDGNNLNTLWGPKVYHSSNGNSFAKAIVYDTAGFVYVTGSSVGSGTGFDYATLRYIASNGTQAWVKTENGAASGNDYAAGIYVTGPFNVYVLGSMNWGSPTGLDYVTIRYTENIGITPIGKEVLDRYSLSQNFPNPFNPSTSIKFDVPKSTLVKLTVYDVLGREIAKLVDDNLNAGSYEVKWDANNITSGIYFYTLVTDKFTETKKMMLVK